MIARTAGGKSIGGTGLKLTIFAAVLAVMFVPILGRTEVGQRPQSRYEDSATGGVVRPVPPGTGRPNSSVRDGPTARSSDAEVCRSERQGVISAQASNTNPSMGRYSEADLSLAKMTANVEAEIRDGGDFRNMAGLQECGPRCDRFQQRGASGPGSPNYREALLLWADLQDLRVARKVGRGALDFAHYRYRGCVARHIAAGLGGGPDGGRAPRAPDTSPKAGDPGSSHVQRGGTQARGPTGAELGIDRARDALRRTEQLQSKLDNARQGARRRHVAEAEAHHCLQLDPNPGYGGFINTCAFDVDYYYCAFHPRKGAWSEVFDCEKQRPGAWHIGSKQRDAAHTKNAELVYWFACRSKMPDGESVYAIDVEFQPGRGLLGRCASWGTRKS